jgi:hypothetical protein
LPVAPRIALAAGTAEVGRPPVGFPMGSVFHADQGGSVFPAATAERAFTAL